MCHGGWNVGVEFIKSGVNQSTSALPCPLPSYIMRPLARRSTYMLWWVECRCGTHQEVQLCVIRKLFSPRSSGKEKHLYVMVGGMQVWNSSRNAALCSKETVITTRNSGKEELLRIMKLCFCI